MKLFKSIFVLILICLCFENKTEAITANDIPIVPYKNNRSDKRKGELALCSMVHNEADYMRGMD